MNTLTMRTIAALAISLLAIGTLGYNIIEHIPLLDAFYMTVITVSTVGYKEVAPMSDLGRIWTITLILVGVTMGTFAATKLAEQFADLRRFRRKKMLKKIEKLNNHYIVCGYGRIGQVIVKELIRKEKPFVIIEKDESLLDKLDPTIYLNILADAIDEETLKLANIKNAKGLVSVISSDADNVFLTMTARDLNEDLYIVTRSVDPNTSKRIRRAGANKVLNPYKFSGYKMSQMLINPNVHDFIDTLRNDQKIEISIRELLIHQDSSFAEKTIKESGIRKNYNVLITAVLKVNDQYIFNPPADLEIQVGDRIIAIGSPKDLEKLLFAD